MEEKIRETYLIQADVKKKYGTPEFDINEAYQLQEEMAERSRASILVSEGDHEKPNLPHTFIPANSDGI